MQSHYLDYLSFTKQHVNKYNEFEKELKDSENYT